MQLVVCKTETQECDDYSVSISKFVALNACICVRACNARVRVVYSSEQDAVVAEQLQSAEMVDREHERMQTELKDEVSSFIDIICA